MFVDPSGNTSMVNFSADGYAYDGFKIDDANKGGGNYRRELQMVGNVLGTVALIALTVKAGELIAENPPLPMRKYQAMVEAKAKAEAEAKAETQAATKSEEKLYYVYVLVDKANKDKVEYVGRTNDYERRAKEHEKDPCRGHLKMVVLYRNLTKEEARGLEQTNMWYHHTLNNLDPKNNQINGISPHNKNIDTYIENGLDASEVKAILADYTRNFLSNEYYCFIEEMRGK
jgi:hypothetical protein